VPVRLVRPDSVLPVRALAVVLLVPRAVLALVLALVQADSVLLVRPVPVLVPVLRAVSVPAVSVPQAAEAPVWAWAAVSAAAEAAWAAALWQARPAQASFSRPLTV
jgi:hypothetical protein